MLQITRLTKSFNTGTALEVNAVKAVDFTLESGSFALLLGSNGSGKSTVLNLLAGTISPDDGEIFLNGQSIRKLPEYKRSAFISRIFQDPAMGTSPDLSLIENFRIASLRKKRKGLETGINTAFKKKVEEKLSGLEMQLESRMHQPMRSFSGGQRQAMALLMATFEPPDLLLLDEPAAALDPKAAAVVKNLIAKIIADQKITTLMVTHDLKHCLELGDRIIQMQGGEIIKNISGATKKQLSLPEIYSWF